MDFSEVANLLVISLSNVHRQDIQHLSRILVGGDIVGNVLTGFDKIFLLFRSVRKVSVVMFSAKVNNHNMTVPELASLANKCLDVVKSELKNRDMPVAFLFIGMTERIISAIGGNTTIDQTTLR